MRLRDPNEDDNVGYDETMAEGRARHTIAKHV